MAGVNQGKDEHSTLDLSLEKRRAENEKIKQWIKAENEKNELAYSNPEIDLSPGELKTRLEKIQNMIDEQKAYFDRMTPEEREQAKEEWRIFQIIMNANRAPGNEVYPDMPRKLPPEYQGRP